MSERPSDYDLDVFITQPSWRDDPDRPYHPFRCAEPGETTGPCQACRGAIADRIIEIAREEGEDV